MADGGTTLVAVRWHASHKRKSRRQALLRTVLNGTKWVPMTGEDAPYSVGCAFGSRTRRRRGRGEELDEDAFWAWAAGLTRSICTASTARTGMA